MESALRLTDMESAVTGDGTQDRGLAAYVLQLWASSDTTMYNITVQKSASSLHIQEFISGNFETCAAKGEACVCDGHVRYGINGSRSPLLDVQVSSLPCPHCNETACFA